MVIAPRCSTPTSLLVHRRCPRPCEPVLVIILTDHTALANHNPTASRIRSIRLPRRYFLFANGPSHQRDGFSLSTEVAMAGTATVSALPTDFQTFRQAMNQPHRSTSNMDYGRKLLNSALEGARSGGETFLHGKPLSPFLAESARSAWKPAALGLCLSALSCYSGRRQKSAAKAVAFGLLGGVVGFGASLLWGSRLLAASAASGALRSIGRARDEHWLEQNPIDYA